MPVKTDYKKKAIALAKIISKKRAKYTCEKCGKNQTQSQMHGAHIMPVTWAATAADPNNILCLCAGCHSMGPNSAHQNPHKFVRWFEDTFPGRYDELEHKATEYSRTKFPKIDWEETYLTLKELYK